MAEFLELVLPIADTETGRATPYFEDYLYQIITGLGGEGAAPVTEIIETSTTLAQAETAIKGLKNRIKFVPRVKNTDYNATDNDFIEASNGITVYLPNPPRDGSDVMVANGDGSKINIDGNGKKIKFKAETDSSVYTKAAGASYHFKWFHEGPYWRIV